MSEIAPVLILGKHGMLGRAFSALLAREQLPFTATDLPEFDFVDRESIARTIGPEVRTVIMPVV